jgi:Fic family protein
MASIIKRTINGIAYYYLEHTVRKNGSVTKKSRYLGRTIPKDFEEIQRRFIFEIDRDRWFERFDRIRNRHASELSRTPKSAREKELRDFSVRFTYDTQRIEGSTLTLRETAELLEEGLTPGARPLKDVREAEAHRRVFFEMLGYRKELSLPVVLEWHRRLFQETDPEIAGKLRRNGVKIAGSRFVPPAPVELQPLLREFFSWYEANKAGKHAVELAALAHLKFVTVHPFSDGNGRVSRLITNFVLNTHGYPMLNIEYRGRRSYYNSLERSQVGKNERTFCLWFFREYIRQHRSLDSPDEAPAEAQ